MAAKSSSFRRRLIDHAKGPMGLASIADELRFAVADIRQKVVEEGVYGRAVTPPVEFVGIHGKMETGAETSELSASFKDRCKDAFDQRQAEEPADRGHVPSHE